MRRTLVTAAAMATVLAVSGTAGAETHHATTTVKHHTTTTVHHTTTTKAPAKPIFQQSGSGTATTRTFTAPNSGWELQWAYNCSNFGTEGNFAVLIQQAPGKGVMASLEDQGVNQLGTQGSGTEHYHYGGGGVYLTIDSECSWSVTVPANAK